MKANFNYLYEQNKDISTGAVADREKGSTTVDRATYVCIRILFHLITGRCFLAGYLEEFSFSLLRRRDEYLAFNNQSNPDMKKQEHDPTTQHKGF